MECTLRTFDMFDFDLFFEKNEQQTCQDNFCFPQSYEQQITLHQSNIWPYAGTRAHSLNMNNSTPFII